MSIHEFDLAEHVYDARDGVGTADHGQDIASQISGWLEENKRSLPQEARYLALGAGRARPELAFAEHLGLVDTQVTVLDRYFSPTVAIYFSQERPNITRIQRGIFTFLGSPSRSGFSLVTAFAMEYVFCDPQKLEMLVKSLPKILIPGSFVSVYPYLGIDQDALWKENGFDVIEGYRGIYSSLLYRYASS